MFILYIFYFVTCNYLHTDRFSWWKPNFKVLDEDHNEVLSIGGPCCPCQCCCGCTGDVNFRVSRDAVGNFSGWWRKGEGLKVHGLVFPLCMKDGFLWQKGLNQGPFLRKLIFFVGQRLIRSGVRIPLKYVSCIIVHYALSTREVLYIITNWSF